MKRTCSTRKISISVLDKNAEANIAIDVTIAKIISPLKAANVKMAEAKISTAAIGRPSKPARTEANVCSCQVIGNQ